MRVTKHILVHTATTTAALLACCAAYPATWHVDDSIAQPGNGEDWPTAFADLQDALAAAVDNPGSAPHVILVAEGTYFPTDNTDREEHFALPPNTVVEGGYAGYDAQDPDLRDITLFETVLSGDLAENDSPDFANYGDNSYNVVVATDVDEHSILDGFTIRGGNANGTLNNHKRGGGMRVGSSIADGSPAIRHCTIKENRVSGSSGFGAGVAVVGPESFPEIRACTITGNLSEGGQSAGGGIAVVSSGAAVLACDISGNTDENDAGAGAGGIFSNRSQVDVHSSRLVDNEVVFGAAVHITGRASHEGGDVRLVNCLIADSLDIDGAINAYGVYVFHANASVVNCTIANNVGGGYTEHDLSLEADTAIRNSILWGNGDGSAGAQIGGSTSPDTVDYNDVQGGYSGGTGNINVDPQFVDAANGDYQLDDDPMSPCVNAGNPDPSVIPADAYDIDEDADFDEKLPDLALETRIVGELVDMGAFEQPVNPYNCAADVNEDGTVNVQDITAMILAWGACPAPPGDCPEDINGDGEVDVQDLTALILNWGADCALQQAPDDFYECIERCGPTEPSCITACGEMFGLFD